MVASPSFDPAALERRVHALRSAGRWHQAWSLLLRTECAAGLRRPRLALYDHALHLIGGGQKYGCLLAAALADRFDLTLLTHRPVTGEQLAGWYRVDLAGVPVETVELPGFDDPASALPDPALLAPGDPNPFVAVSRVSADYDLFVNNSMNERVLPLAGRSLAICHFPERRPRGEFYMHRYGTVVVNSEYTRRWLRRRWRLEADRLVHPPVDGGPPPPAGDKRPLVLSVARFERAGSKRQLDMVRVFGKLKAALPRATAGWRLVLCGGVEPAGNDYLRRVEQAVAALPGDDVELRLNLPDDELRRLYRRAAIFWHLCGLDARDPALREHFGMTVAEAMQFGAVPVVFDGGGPAEIVEDGATGYRVGSTAALIERTLTLIGDGALRARLAAAAATHAARYGMARFDAEVRALFDEQLAAYVGELPALLAEDGDGS